MMRMWGDCEACPNTHTNSLSYEDLTSYGLRFSRVDIQ